MTTASATPLVLDYGITAIPRTRPLQWLMLVLSLPSLVVPFLDFYWHVSPLDAVVEPFVNDWVEVPLALLGFGFFVAFPIIAWRTHLLWREPRRRARRAYLASALLAWAGTVALNALWYREMIRRVREEGWALPGDAYPFLLAGPVAVIGLLIAWRLHARGSANRALTVALTTPYLANAAICLLGFADGDPTIGYVLALFVSLVWALEIGADVLGLVRGR